MEYSYSKSPNEDLMYEYKLSSVFLVQNNYQAIRSECISPADNDEGRLRDKLRESIIPNQNGHPAALKAIFRLLTKTNYGKKRHIKPLINKLIYWN